MYAHIFTYEQLKMTKSPQVHFPLQNLDIPLSLIADCTYPRHAKDRTGNKGYHALRKFGLYDSPWLLTLPTNSLSFCLPLYPLLSNIIKDTVLSSRICGTGVFCPGVVSYSNKILLPSFNTFNFAGLLMIQLAT